MDPNTDSQQPAAATTPPTDKGTPAEPAAAPKGSGKKAAADAPQPTDQLLADTPAAATTPPEPSAPRPEQVVLAAPHGFIDEETGAHRFWPAGAIVKAEDEIKLLLSRLAPLVGIDYKD